MLSFYLYSHRRYNSKLITKSVYILVVLETFDRNFGVYNHRRDSYLNNVKSGNNNEQIKKLDQLPQKVKEVV